MSILNRDPTHDSVRDGYVDPVVGVHHDALTTENIPKFFSWGDPNPEIPKTGTTTIPGQDDGVADRIAARRKAEANAQLRDQFAGQALPQAMAWAKWTADREPDTDIGAVSAGVAYGIAEAMMLERAKRDEAITKDGAQS